MATVGRVLLELTRHLPQLMLTTSGLALVVSARHTVPMLVGTVSPSAVWYTNYV